MSEAKRCPQCHAEIPAAAPEGLCPQCLLQAALDSKTADAEVKTAAYTPSGSGFVPPTPEVLQAAFPQLEILELLGKGGMGAVYKARQRGLDRLVAVKILPPEFSQDPAFAERFLREAKALGMLSHPNIVGIHDIGQTASYCYFVMEYVDGVNLRQAMRAGTLKSAEALKIVPQICEALQFAHDEGIVHRDIKPENILLDKKGRVKIADFGLAKLLGKTHDVTLTGTQQVMGTMHYMAPEQLEGSRDIDHRADIYSLGVTFYEMLTGELPIGRFAAPSKKVQIDVRLDEVVLRSLEKEPELRYQHASEIKTEIETIASGPVAAAGGPSTAKLDTPISVPYAGVIPTGPFDLGAFGMLHFDGVFLEFEITKRGFFSNSRLQSVRIPLAEVKSMWVEKRKPPAWGLPAPRLWSLYLRTNRMRALDDLPFGSQGQVELFLEPENVAAAQELQKAVSRTLQGHQEHAREIKTETEGIVGSAAQMPSVRKQPLSKGAARIALIFIVAMIGGGIFMGIFGGVLYKYALSFIVVIGLPIIGAHVFAAIAIFREWWIRPSAFLTKLWRTSLLIVGALSILIFLKPFARLGAGLHGADEISVGIWPWLSFSNNDVEPDFQLFASWSLLAFPVGWLAFWACRQSFIAAQQDLEKEPELRYQHASEIKTEMETIARGPAAPASQPKATPRQKNAPVKRPWGVPILAVINGVVAIASVFLAAYDLLHFGDNGADMPDDEWQRQLFNALHIGSTVAGYLVSFVMIVAAVGLLFWKPWARWLTVATAVFRIALWVVALPLVIVSAFNWLATNELRLGVPELIMLAVIGIPILCAGTIYQIFVVVYLTRPRIIAAFSTTARG